MAMAANREGLLKAFTGINHHVDSEEVLLKKCAEVCQEFGMSPTDLVTKWEVYTENRGLDGPPKVDHIEAVKSEMMRKMKVKQEKDVVVQRGSNKVFNKGSLGGLASSLSDNYGSKASSRIKAEPPSTPSSFAGPSTPGGSYVTPMKRKGPDTPSSSMGGGSRMRPLPATPSTEMAMQESSPEAASFHKREQRLKVHSTFNEALPSCLGQPAPLPSGGGSRVEIKALQVCQPESYMYDKVENKCHALRDRLKEVVDGIIANARLRETAGEEGFSISPVNAASQERVWCCGRICAEGDAASLNPTSVMLEGANGRRVKLDLTGVPEFAVFPGQVVVVNGHNSTGSVIKVLAIYCDASMPVAKTPASQIALFNETDAYLGGVPLSVFTAAGPFTTSADLSYKPLDDLLEHVVAEGPDVLILCGPFVDCKHRLLDPSAAGQPGGFSNGVPPDTATIMRAVMRDRIAKALAGTTTACIIVPSPSDVHARPLFPQPAFSADVVNGEDGGMPVVLMSNPCTFKINEVVFQVSTQDVLVHLSGNEASKMTGDRMARLGKHLIQQRSVYPMFPYAEGAQIASMLTDSFKLPYTPDILLIPSNLVPFAKRCGDTLLLNPGRLTKGNTAGTFARTTIHPILRHIRVGGRVTAEPPPVTTPSGSPCAGRGSSASGFASDVVPTELSSEFAAAHVASETEVRGEAVVDEAGYEARMEEAPAAERAANGAGSEAPMEEAAGSESSKAADAEGDVEAKEEPAEESIVETPSKTVDVHGEVAHRVVERTRVEIVRI